MFWYNWTKLALNFDINSYLKLQILDVESYSQLHKTVNEGIMQDVIPKKLSTEGQIQCWLPTLLSLIHKSNHFLFIFFLPIAEVKGW